MNQNDHPAGFASPRPTEEPGIARLYEELGIGATPSIKDMEPHAISMMKEGKILEAMGLVLGRSINAEEAEEDLMIKVIALQAAFEPEKAFGSLLLKLSIEEMS